MVAPLPSTWKLRPRNFDLAQKLSAELGLLPLTAEVLTGRGLDTPAAVRAFLDPVLTQLSDPAELPGAPAAIQRIAAAIRAGELILVYGDYDVDGVTSVTVLLKVLGALGAKLAYHIPTRQEEGYGLRAERLTAAAAEGVRLVVTVDNGISAHAEVEAASRLGLDVIVTDHHTPPEGSVVPALAVVHPRVSDHPAPYPHLVGVGVAFKLAWGVATEVDGRGGRVSESLRRVLMDCLGLAALGTVADVAPLTGENRILVRAGLAQLAASTHPGVVALKQAAKVGGDKVVARDIAFRLAPRINAAGRMGHAARAVELFTTTDPVRAMALARELETDNTRRREVEAEILDLARAALAKLDLERTPFCVLAGEGWHSGVIGIAAAKLTEELGRPVAMVSLSGDLGRGSARSVPQVHLTELLARASEHLVAFGGHAAAAGFTVRRESLPALAERLGLATQERHGNVCSWPKTQDIDAVCELDALSRQLVDEFARLAPFGAGNPAPLLASTDLTVAGRPRLMGQGSKHLSFMVRQGDTSLRAVGFNLARHASRLDGARCHLAYRPVMNQFNGRAELELEVVEILVAG